jgi:hypothetical protein
MGTDLFEGVFMVSSQLRNDAIIGCQFFKEYGICINLSKGSISYVRDDVVIEQAFVTKARLQSVKGNDRGETKEVILQNDPSTVQRPQTQSADCEDPVLIRAANSCSIPTPDQTIAGQERALDLQDGSSSSFMCLSRTIEESKGSVSLDYGAECDQLSGVFKLPDTGISDVLSIQSRGC